MTGCRNRNLFLFTRPTKKIKLFLSLGNHDHFATIVIIILMPILVQMQFSCLRNDTKIENDFESKKMSNK